MTLKHIKLNKKGELLQNLLKFHQFLHLYKEFQQQAKLLLKLLK